MATHSDSKFTATGQTFVQLLEVMARLRGPDGCPWDKKQTHESLKACLLEECYEVLAAIDANDPHHLQEELGDLLLQVVFHSQMASELGDFQIEDVLNTLIEKLTRRHPHVFGEEVVEHAEAAISRWEQIKAQEKKHKNLPEGLFSGIPKELPALLRAYRIGGKAARVNFDWPKVEDIWGKAEEEIRELKEAMAEKNPQAIEEEWGDLFFTLAQVARRLKVNPEEALRKSSNKFEARFAWMEQKVQETGKDIHELSAEEWETLWKQAKSFTESV